MPGTLPNRRFDLCIADIDGCLVSESQHAFDIPMLTLVADHNRPGGIGREEPTARRHETGEENEPIHGSCPGAEVDPHLEMIGVSASRRRVKASRTA